MMNLKSSGWTKWFVIYGVLIYRTIWSVGGILGGCLFYTKTIQWIYTYLTSHGFYNPDMVRQIEDFTIILITAFIILMLFYMFIQMMLSSRYVSKRSIVIKCILSCIVVFSRAGFIIVCIYYCVSQTLDGFFIGWLIYIGFMLIYRMLFNRAVRRQLNV
ncbi:FtsX-like permease family protein [Listeria welshimeri]|nr:hypothetical protein [Listeria monocytogenes]MBC1250583.1 FtsX-like permease family protein [Listeria welshimeri]EAD4958588.1 hypothetical protein [Listeria monocytogenes]MBC1462031.1 FtsX-like permease family protein [Listeria welshimeri]MBC1716628.1 FtsX-like permease family protein [Listeria welshimeri]